MTAVSSFLAGAAGATWLGLRRPYFIPQSVSPSFASQGCSQPLPACHHLNYGASLLGPKRIRLNPRKKIALYANAPNKDPATGDNTSSTGPPLLTILAGIVVFLLLLWIVGTIVMWLVGLIVNVPPS